MAYKRPYKFGSTYERPYKFGSTYQRTYKFGSTDKCTYKFGSTYKQSTWRGPDPIKKNPGLSCQRIRCIAPPE